MITFTWIPRYPDASDARRKAEMLAALASVERSAPVVVRPSAPRGAITF